MTLRGLRGIESALGRYDFDGSCIRVSGRSYWRNGSIQPMPPGQESFSLGVFRFTERADGGLKRSKVVKRIRGRFGTGDDSPERAFEAAEKVCMELEARR